VPVAIRPYGQHCALAKSLELVGDRWTLLVVRELLDGPRRYNDLLAALAPIATDMLAGRLRHLEQHGLVRRCRLDPPASGTVYELTDDGAALEEVVHAFARWGRHLLEQRRDGDTVQPAWLARAVRAYLRPDRTGPAVTVRLVIPEGAVTLRIDRAGVTTLPDETGPDETGPDVTLTGDVDVLAAALDPRRVPALVESGRLRVDGSPAAARRLAKWLLPPRQR